MKRINLVYVFIVLMVFSCSSEKADWPDPTVEKGLWALRMQSFEMKAGEIWQLPERIVHAEAASFLGEDGSVTVLQPEEKFTPPVNGTVYIAERVQTGDDVKRPSPGGEGLAIDTFNEEITNWYLEEFWNRLGISDAEIRCFFHDSFEYAGSFTPNFTHEFRKLRGYVMGEVLHVLAGDYHDEEVVDRVRSDYRETVSDLVLGSFMQPMKEWANSHQSLFRNQAHGSPGNILDIYAASDIPETEIFGRVEPGTTAVFVNKFASSAAELGGRRNYTNIDSGDNAGWFMEFPLSGLSESLKNSGYTFDYVSDKQLLNSKVSNGEDWYMVFNCGIRKLDAWVELRSKARSYVLYFPETGEISLAANQGDSVRIQLEPERAVFIRCSRRRIDAPQFVYMDQQNESFEVKGLWNIEFIEGGPVYPESITTDRLYSWARLGNDQTHRFSGTARYWITFDWDKKANSALINLGDVKDCAHVKLNGKAMGSLLGPTFKVKVDNLVEGENLLEVEVTNVAANRIRDYDIRGVDWKRFYDINFVNITYRPFDASDWEISESRLLGPVTILNHFRLLEQFFFA